jgi:hypothetical protein
MAYMVQTVSAPWYLAFEEANFEADNASGLSIWTVEAELIMKCKNLCFIAYIISKLVVNVYVSRLSAVLFQQLESIIITVTRKI